MAYKKRSRRSYGSGSITINNTIGRYTVVWNDEYGKRHSKSTFPLNPVGKKQAEAFLNEINQYKNAGISVGTANTLEYWILNKIDSEIGTVRATTTTSRKYDLKRIRMYHPTLLDTPISEISEGMIQQLYRNMEAEGLKPATIARTHVLLSGAFRNAVAQRAIAYNIIKNVSHASIKKPEIEVFSWQEIGKIFLFLRKQKKRSNRVTHNHYLYFRILQGTGIRVGELLALRWADINVKTREIHIHATTSNEDKVIEAPKTRAGDRMIPILSDKLLKLLDEAKQATDNEFVITTEKGNRMRHAMFQRQWDKVKDGTGINKKIHTFRHTWATVQLKRGFPLVEISRILGHSSPRITLDTYSHAIPSYNQQMIAEYKKMIEKSNGKQDKNSIEQSIEYTSKEVDESH